MALPQHNLLSNAESNRRDVESKGRMSKEDSENAFPRSFGSAVLLAILERTSHSMSQTSSDKVNQRLISSVMKSFQTLKKGQGRASEYAEEEG